MTKPRYDKKDTPFGNWLRMTHQDEIGSHIAFSTTNLDYVWHNYIESWFILIEEKKYGSTSDFAQIDTQGVLCQMLDYVNPQQLVVETARGLRLVDYRGFYRIVFSNTHPDNSRKITINDCPASSDDILELLKTGMSKIALPWDFAKERRLKRLKKEEEKLKRKTQR